MDLSRSGAISAFNRPELGPWLTDPDKIAAWDILVCTKLDRACRSTADYLKLRQWCADNGKRFVSLANAELDESTPTGKAMGSLQAIFAELERDMARERALETRAALIEAGRWTGGRIPYGWTPEKRADGYYLVPDESGAAPVLRKMAEMAINGRSNGQICKWLNDQGIPTGRGYRWRADTTRAVLRARTTAELLGDEMSAQLRAALRTREQHRGERVGGHMLLRVAFCASCQGPMYCQVRANYPGGGYYRCLPCGLYIRKDRLEKFTEAGVLDAAGDRKLRRKVLVPGDDHARQVAKLEAQLEQVREVPLVDTSALEAEIARLKALPHEPDTYRWVPTGETVAEHWTGLTSNEEKGTFLRQWGVRFEVDLNKGGRLITGGLDPDEDTYDLPGVSSAF